MADDLFEKYREDLNKLNLKTVDDLENLVKPLIKDATKLILKKRQEKAPKDTNQKSHFGGQPYFEKGEQWPVAKSGSKLEFVFQIFNEEWLTIPENIKLIQFYYDFEECPWDTKEDGWLVKVYENIDKSNCITIEKSEEHGKVHYCEIGYEKIKSLPDWDGISSFEDNASKLSCILDEEEPWGHYYEMVYKLIGEMNDGSQLGGYANYIQGGLDPDDKNFIFLFQIDSEAEAGLHWSDCGMVYVFYNSKTKEIKFRLQCC